MSNYFVHESAYVDDRVAIGKGTKIWHFSHIMQNTVIGENCVIGQNVMVGPQVKIGNGCKIQNNVSVYEAVELEDEVFCGPSRNFNEGQFAECIYCGNRYKSEGNELVVIKG